MTSREKLFSSTHSREIGKVLIAVNYFPDE
jgi:hypothetical protein